MKTQPSNKSNKKFRSTIFAIFENGYKPTQSIRGQKKETDKKKQKKESQASRNQLLLWASQAHPMVMSRISSKFSLNVSPVSRRSAMGVKERIATDRNDGHKGILQLLSARSSTGHTLRLISPLPPQLLPLIRFEYFLMLLSLIEYFSYIHYS